MGHRAFLRVSRNGSFGVKMLNEFMHHLVSYVLNEPFMHFSRASMSSINQAMASGVTPLHIACQKGHTEVAAM
eukprot:4883864-Prymnesium_polylepis.1